MEIVDILGFRVSAEGVERDVARAVEWVEAERSCRYMACANPHSLVVASRDGQFGDALRQADLLTPDGVGVVLAARFLNRSLTRRVIGYDFFMALTARLAMKRGARYFFFGSSEQVLELMVSRLNREFPAVNVCGIYAPPFRDSFSEEENARMVEAINDARPDVLWVGMTAPKQEKWIYENRAKLRVPFISAVGAVFDFYAGTAERPPAVWQKLGMEWLYRFIREPGRLWERNLVSTPKFIWMVLREKARCCAAMNKAVKM
jgi:N-acetylglucosaminyldiphosphoundecaprenol N-acetyl-beta-D-mannosaminyltransferase